MLSMRRLCGRHAVASVLFPWTSPERTLRQGVVALASIPVKHV